MSCLKDSFLNLGEVEIVFTHFSLKFYFTQTCALSRPSHENLDILISSLLFRYSIFNELSFALTHLKSSGGILVEIKGIEPLTPCLQSRCSPS